MDVNRTILRPNGRKGDSLHRAKFSRRDRFVRHIGDEAESCKSPRAKSKSPRPKSKPPSPKSEGQASESAPAARGKTNRRKESSRPARPSPRIHRHCLAHHSGGWGADENRNGARRPAEAMNGILGASLGLQVAQCRRNHEIFERRRRKSVIPACPSRLCKRTWRGTAKRSPLEKHEAGAGGESAQSRDDA